MRLADANDAVARKIDRKTPVREQGMGAAVSACTRQDPNLLNVIRRTLMCVNYKASLLNEPGQGL
jgi:hypothetical protein